MKRNENIAQVPWNKNMTLAYNEKLLEGDTIKETKEKDHI